MDFDTKKLLEWAENGGRSFKEKSGSNYKGNKKQQINNNHQKEKTFNRDNQNIDKFYGDLKDTYPKTKPDDIATAPYNFIPLPDNILVSPMNEAISTEISSGNDEKFRAAFCNYIESTEKLNGYIDLNLKTKTPLFIGGNGENTFAPTGEIIIAGSTIRGMVKNLFKIITCGTMRGGEDVTSRHLYYRCMMAPNSAPFNKFLHETYVNKMTSTDSKGNIKKNAKPGFLVKQGNNYYIYPTINNKVHSILILDFEGKYNIKDNKSRIHWDFKDGFVYCLTGVGLSFRDREKLKTKEEIEKFMKNTKSSERYKLGKQYIKYFDIHEIDKSRAIRVPDSVIDEYTHDKNRRGVDLIDTKKNEAILTTKKYGEFIKNIGLGEIDSIVPCFYIQNGDEIQAFGHGQSFRIPYDHSIMDTVPSNLQENVIDFADSVFGRSTNSVSWASRVFFEDAIPTRTVELIKPDFARPLMQPNPTAFQLYLRQDLKEKLIHWEEERAKIRGYKLYWHNKDKHKWQASDEERNYDSNVRDKSKESLLKKITPIKSDNEFCGKIRFKNLSRIELGALLKVFALSSNKGEEDIVYKIGQGKSIGLGSIEVNATLYLEDDTSYEFLFDDDCWHDSMQKTENIEEYIQEFESYVDRKGLNEDYKIAIENLRYMLNFKHTELGDRWEKVTAYMAAPMNNKTKNNNTGIEDTRFKNRNVLPTVSTVIDRAYKESKSRSK